MRSFNKAMQRVHSFLCIRRESKIRSKRKNANRANGVVEGRKAHGCVWLSVALPMYVAVKTA